jgi:uncharacterized protein YjeT (DUF2065 family)
VLHDGFDASALLVVDEKVARVVVVVGEGLIVAVCPTQLKQPASKTTTFRQLSGSNR